jgi:hypothetical protein
VGRCRRHDRHRRLDAGSAAAFGTIDSGGQNREQERTTRAALACVGDGGIEDCFEPKSMIFSLGMTASAAPSARRTSTSCRFPPL